MLVEAPMISSSITLQKLESFQRSFRNCIAIIVGEIDVTAWFAFNIQASGGQLRLLHAVDWKKASIIAKDCYNSMKQHHKLKMQEEYFEKEAALLTSSETAKKVLVKAFQRLGVEESDAQIIFEGFPSIAHVVSATNEEMQSNSPANADAIDRITMFFGFEA